MTLTKEIGTSLAFVEGLDKGAARPAPAGRDDRAHRLRASWRGGHKRDGSPDTNVTVRRTESWTAC